MSSHGEQERERLKKEYKEHYRRIKEAKERLKRAEKTSKIQGALNNMNADAMLESVDEFLGKVRDKVANVEARLDVAMDNLDEDESGAGQKIKDIERDEELKKAKAKETLKQAKIEMGMLYSEIEKQADAIKAEKTIGTKPEAEHTEGDTDGDPHSPDEKQ